jgi:cysteinyl-tRNA synthetase
VSAEGGRDLKLYDSLTKQAGLVEPRTHGELSMYICGPTVYNFVHIGNARPYWVGQVLQRFVGRRLGWKVRLVVNITDVDDKIYRRAREEGVGSRELAARYRRAYVEDTDRLGLGRPDVEPLATETIPQIVSLIEQLIERGLAYVADGDVYFRVAAFPGYGALSGQRVEDLLAGARIEPGDVKESAPDFALWKGTKPDEDVSWPSPWGPGRPGWHIECSAMAREHLGDGFDVHGGGLDLVFPHHENERAQSEGAGAHPFTRRWLHNGMLRLGDAKMSKSVGNVERLRDALDRLGPETLLAFFAGASYRMPIDYHARSLEQAASVAERFRETFRNARRYARSAAGGADAGIATVGRDAAAAFDAAMADDLDTPAALAVLHGLASELNAAVSAEDADPAAVGAAADSLRDALWVLGLHTLDPGTAVAALPPDVVALAEQRVQTRLARDFEGADRLRDEIARRGYVVRDTPQGFELVERDAAP